MELHDQTSLISTSMLPRVAFEYGRFWWAISTRAAQRAASCPAVFPRTAGLFYSTRARVATVPRKTVQSGMPFRLSSMQALWLPILAIGGGVLVWLFAGRWIVLLVDRFATVRVKTLPAGPLVYSPGNIAIGDYALEVTDRGGRLHAIGIDVDPDGRIQVHTGNKVFPLGVRIGLPDKSGRTDIPFAPDPGDDVALVLDRSVLAWPTPFDLNFMTGISPTRRRNLYFRLTWRKRSGATLDMVWRYEELYYAREGWTGSYTSRDNTTGLVDVRMAAANLPEPETVKAYLARTRGWSPSDYRIEERGFSPDGCCIAMLVVHRLDESAAAPGGGRSLELYVDRVTRRIDRELSLQ
ncbi:MAG: hypothetical protein P4L83_09665 [Nevskia sp.]|nr:hypothetical protein [Nevskia sp.]